MRCKENYKTRLEEEMINGKLRASWLALAIVGKRACCAIMLQVDTQVLFFALGLCRPPGGGPRLDHRARIQFRQVHFGEKP